MATHSSILAWRIPWTKEPGGLVHGVAKGWTRLSDFTFFLSFHLQFKCSRECYSTSLGFREQQSPQQTSGGHAVWMRNFLLF